MSVVVNLSNTAPSTITTTGTTRSTVASVTDTRPQTVTTLGRDNTLINVNPGADVQSIIEAQLGSVGVDIVPDENGSRDIGTAAICFQDIFMTSNGAIYFGNNKITYSNNQVLIDSFPQTLVGLDDVQSSGLANGGVLYYDGTDFRFGPINDDIDISGSVLVNKIAGHDGPDSGLDADTLDGLQGSYYLNAGNFTFPNTYNFSGNSVTFFTDYSINPVARIASKETLQAIEGTFVADEFSESSKTAKYVISISDGLTNDRYASELLVTHNGTTPNYVVYGEVVAGNSEVIYPNFDTDIVDAKVRLHITTGANNHLVRLTRTELH